MNHYKKLRQEVDRWGKSEEVCVIAITRLWFRGMRVIIQSLKLEGIHSMQNMLFLEEMYTMVVYLAPIEMKNEEHACGIRNFLEKVCRQIGNLNCNFDDCVLKEKATA